jgi:hypothetical protein
MRGATVKVRVRRRNAEDDAVDPEDLWPAEDVWVTEAEWTDIETGAWAGGLTSPHTTHASALAEAIRLAEEPQ